jgi:hypothetical protein
MGDTNSSSTTTSFSFDVVEYCRCCNRFFCGGYNSLWMMLLMTAKMAVMEVDDDGCDENVEFVCMWFVGRDADDDIHCKEGKKGNRKHLGRQIP